MAVLVQTMVDANVAGVAFSANPLTGDRSEVVVNATRGLADALVAGMSDGDEWSVRDGEARRTSHSESAIDAQLALRVATLARRVEVARGGPQDIEWAAEGDRLMLLQARAADHRAPHRAPNRGAATGATGGRRRALGIVASAVGVRDQATTRARAPDLRVRQ